MRFISAIFIIFLLCSCTHNRNVRGVEKFVGQQIYLPQDWDAVWRGRDTVLNDFIDVPIKLVVWVDSLGCASCEVSQMSGWKDIVGYADSLAHSFRIIYLFTPKRHSSRGVKVNLRPRTFDYPLFLDRNATFVKLNPNLPQNPKLHTFLLDKNNKVVCVGSPLHNASLWAFYKKTIQSMMDNDGILPER